MVISMVTSSDGSGASTVPSVAVSDTAKEMPEVTYTIQTLLLVRILTRISDSETLTGTYNEINDIVLTASLVFLSIHHSIQWD